MGILGSIRNFFSGSLTPSTTPDTYEGRVERYQKWQEELMQKEREEKHLEAEIFNLQKRLKSEPNNTRYNSRYKEANKKLAKLGHEMSVLKNNLYLHKP